MAKPLMVTYHEYYPHMEGTLTCNYKFDVMHLLLLLQLASELTWGGAHGTTLMDDDTSIALEDLCSEECLAGIGIGGKQYAFFEALTNQFEQDSINNPGKYQRKVLNALKRKGWFYGTWEEGSYYFALPGFEKPAAEKMRIAEAKMLDIGDFDDD
jgi:hypothetical protein